MIGRSVRSKCQPALKAVNSRQQQVRNMSVHEHIAMDMLRKYGVNVPESKAAFSAEEAETVAQSFPKPNELVIKAQVLAGGRGKGHFDGPGGLQGGVHMVDSPAQAKEYAAQMLGKKLITKQTGEAGRICNAIMLAAREKPVKEYYCAILNDRATGGPVLVTSPRGGMNIEDVARDEPDAITTTPIPFEFGFNEDTAVELAHTLGYESSPEQFYGGQMFRRLYKLFQETDATQVEINPVGIMESGMVMCMDAKLGFDENAEFRQKEIFENFRDKTQEDPSEVEAAEHGLNFIKLDGDIGCLVNGAGLAMATMDVLKLHGGSPANFLDIGGGATPETVKKAFELLLRDPKTKSIFVNIFGGIMRCDYVAEGIIEATKALEMKIPLIVRLQGTKVEEGKKLINESGMKIFAYDGLDEAAEAAVVKAGLKA